MPRLNLLLILGLSLLGLRVVAVERTEQHIWPVGDNPIVQLQTFRGTVTVGPTSSGHVELAFTARSSDDRDRDWVNGVAVRADQFGSGLAIRVTRQGSGVELTLGRAAPVREVVLNLKVPAGSQLDLLTRDGSIDVANDVATRVLARNEFGDVFIGRVEGSVKAETQRGNLVVARATGDLKLRNRLGDILVGTVLGDGTVRADSGNIEITNVVGRLDAEAVAGDLDVSFTREIRNNVRLRASAGDVRVNLDPAAAVEVQAHSDWGKVKSEVTFDDGSCDHGKRRLNGKLNGGGPVLVFDASGGDVNILSVPSFL